jgi:hypothetical protein
MYGLCGSTNTSCCCPVTYSSSQTRWHTNSYGPTAYRCRRCIELRACIPYLFGRKQTLAPGTRGNNACDSKLFQTCQKASIMDSTFRIKRRSRIESIFGACYLASACEMASFTPRVPCCEIYSADRRQAIGWVPFARQPPWIALANEPKVLDVKLGASW